MTDSSAAYEVTFVGIQEIHPTIQGIKKKTIVKRGIETRQGSLILVLLKGIVDPAYEHLT